jgi:ankyrin repeat protein
MVSFLLAHGGADPNLTAAGISPLLGAVAGENGLGRASIALTLIADPRVDVNARCPGGVCTLNYAIRREITATFDALIARPDIDLRACTNTGQTLLHAAAHSAAMAAALLKRGVIDVNAVDAAGETALHRAVIDDAADVVAVLLSEPGINPSIATARGTTPLHLALAGRKTAIAEALIAFPGTNVNASSSHWPTPIAVAIREGLNDCVRALCAREDVDVTGTVGTKNAWAPLPIAAYYGNAEMIEILLRCPRINRENVECGAKIAALVAMKMEFSECVKLLTPPAEETPQPQRKKKEKLGFLKRFRRVRRGPNTA